MSEITNENSWYSNTEAAVQPAETPKEKNSMGKKVVALVLCCSLLSACAGAGGALFASKVMNREKAQEITMPDNAALSSLYMSNRQDAIVNTVNVNPEKMLTAAEVYAANVNSTVGIRTEITTTNFWGYQSSAATSGSGFIVSEDGYIVTNYHVIESAKAVTVSLYDGRELEAKIAGYDSSKDFAIIKVDADDLQPVILGSSDKMNVGDGVIAIGNPLGELTFTLTSGVISAKDREITMSSLGKLTLLQTDCAINSGNSGGALFNMYGEVVGITNSKYSGNSSSGASIDSISFAVPIDSVISLINQVIEKGVITYPYIGVSVMTVSEESKSYGIPAGAAIAVVDEDTPAAAAGLKENDIITAFDGQEIETSNEIINLVAKTKPGEDHVFTIYRQGESIEITVTIGEKRQTMEEAQPKQEQSSGISGFGGFNFPGMPW